MGASDEEKREQALRKEYLEWVVTCCCRVPLAGLAYQDEAALAAVYTPLNTLTPIPDYQRQVDGATPTRDAPRLSALAELNRHQLLTLSGDAGSGKSTFVDFVAMCMAGEGLGSPTMGLGLLNASRPDAETLAPANCPRWEHGYLLPIRVAFLDLASQASRVANMPAHPSECLWQCLASQVETPTLREIIPILKAELLDRGGLVLLDGLDEISWQSHVLARIEEIIRDLIAAFPLSRVLITTRSVMGHDTVSYPQGFATTKLSPLDPGQISEFVDRWYSYLVPRVQLPSDEARARADTLKADLLADDARLALAQLPLHLSLLAGLYTWQSRVLPRNEAELYEQGEELLRAQWNGTELPLGPRGRSMPRERCLTDWLQVNKSQMRILVARTAFDLNRGIYGPPGTSDLPSSDLIQGLLNLSGNAEITAGLLGQDLEKRKGLIWARKPDSYALAHSQLTEYLAATAALEGEAPAEAAAMIRSDLDHWSQGMVRAAPRSERTRPGEFWALLEALCSAEPQLPIKMAQARAACLTGKMIQTVGLREANDRCQPLVERIRRWLVRVLETGNLGLLERVDAGDVLAGLIDPRFNPGVFSLPNDPLLGFIFVPEGPFWMGSPAEEIPRYIKEFDLGSDWEGRPGAEKILAEWYQREVPQHQVWLPGFYMARYPVTLRQFREYVQASGQPCSDGDAKRGADNHPVDGVSWVDAMRYCEWLTAGLRSNIATPEPLAFLLRHERWVVTLPSEAEWEKAARGPSSGLELGRLYPWGNEFDADRANVKESGLGTTTAVGSFPRGASPYGVMDLSGNVWEWTRTLWGTEDPARARYAYPYDPGDGREYVGALDNSLRVLRGGSCVNYRRYARCATRRAPLPEYKSSHRGFRTVVTAFRE